VNVAAALLAWDMVVVQVPVPEQSPDQPMNVVFVSGVAVRVTLVPDAMLALHVAPHSMAAGDEVTTPAPTLDTVRG